MRDRYLVGFNPTTHSRIYGMAEAMPFQIVSVFVSSTASWESSGEECLAA